MGPEGNGAGAVLRPLSGRTKAALQQHQSRIAALEKELQRADRVLSGALTACDAPSQPERMAAYLESVQELRVGLQRLEAFLMQRLTHGIDGCEDAQVEHLGLIRVRDHEPHSADATGDAPRRNGPAAQPA